MINSNGFCMSRVAVVKKKIERDDVKIGGERRSGKEREKKEEEVVRMNVDSNDDLCLPAGPQWPGPILTSLGPPPTTKL